MLFDYLPDTFWLLRDGQLGEGLRSAPRLYRLSPCCRTAPRSPSGLFIFLYCFGELLFHAFQGVKSIFQSLTSGLETTLMMWSAGEGERWSSRGEPTSCYPAPLGAELYTQAMADAKLLVASQIIKSSGSQGSDAIREQAADGLPRAPCAAPMCASPGYFSLPAS